MLQTNLADFCRYVDRRGPPLFYRIQIETNGLLPCFPQPHVNYVVSPLFSGAVIIGFASAYWFVRDEIEDALRADVMSTSDALARRLSREPPDVAFAAMRPQHTAALFAGDGTLVIGDGGFTPFRLARDPG